jgi:uncharacterized membrane protein YeaQ/YmgE (transglycosylase-associated protein family)
MTRSPRVRALRGALWLNLALLVVVFLLGMTVNLYIAFPANLKIDAMQFAAHTPSIQWHMIVASLILLVGLAALALSLLERHIGAIGATLAGLALAVVAYSGGMMFLTNGYQESASMMMAVGFIGAFVSYALGAIATHSQATAALATAR